MTADTRPRVALAWRGDPQSRATASAQRGRLAPVFREGVAGEPAILALDMYEHAYAIDYGAKAGANVDAFMAGINWMSAAALFAKVAA